MKESCFHRRKQFSFVYMRFFETNSNKCSKNACVFKDKVYNIAIGNRLLHLERKVCMRSRSTELMNQICAYVNDFFRENRRSPSLNDIAKANGIVRSTAYRYLVEMNDRGMLSYDGHTIETPQIEKCVSGYFSAPIVGSIRCGDPELEEQHVEEYVSLPESIFGKGNFYVLRASGDSMVDAGVQEMDLVVIRKDTEAAIGDIVVALDDENQNTLKRFAGYDDDGYALLKYENQEKYPDKVIKVRQLIVQGVAKHVIKAL